MRVLLCGFVVVIIMPPFGGLPGFAVGLGFWFCEFCGLCFGFCGIDFDADWIAIAIDFVCCLCAMIFGFLICFC